MTVIFAIVSSHFHFCTSPDYVYDTGYCKTAACKMDKKKKASYHTCTPQHTHAPHHSSRMIQVQMQMAERALELLSLPADQPCYILDVG